MHSPNHPPAPRLRPAWRGIAGWALFVLALALAAIAPWPYNGQSLLAVLLGALGMILVAAQVRRAER